ncbi:CoA transferase [Streptomyces profundus]|nr:CoA transferase [Streptomyces sp. MA3_2.13]
MGTYRPGVPPPFGSFRTRDGYLVIAAGNDKLFGALCTALDRPDLAQDERFVRGESRKDDEAALRREIEATLAGHTTAHWCDVLGTAGVPFGTVNTVDAMLADPHVAGRSMLVEAGEGAALPQAVGTPIKFSDIPDLTRVRAAPELDQDRARILAELATRAGDHAGDGS